MGATVSEIGALEGLRDFTKRLLVLRVRDLRRTRAVGVIGEGAMSRSKRS
jgi:hypothetical protein